MSMKETTRTRLRSLCYEWLNWPLIVCGILSVLVSLYGATKISALFDGSYPVKLLAFIVIGAALGGLMHVGNKALWNWVYAIRPLPTEEEPEQLKIDGYFDKSDKKNS